MAYARSGSNRSYARKGFSGRKGARKYGKGRRSYSTRYSRKKAFAPSGGRMARLSQRVHELEKGSATKKATKQVASLPVPVNIPSAGLMATRLPVTALVPAEGVGSKFSISGVEISFDVSFGFDVELVALCYRVDGVELGQRARQDFQLGMPSLNSFSPTGPTGVSFFTGLTLGAPFVTGMVPRPDGGKPHLGLVGGDGTFFSAALRKESVQHGCEVSLDLEKQKGRQPVRKAHFYLSTDHGQRTTRHVRFFWNWSRKPPVASIRSGSGDSVVFDSAIECLLAARVRIPQLDDNKKAFTAGVLENLAVTVHCRSIANALALEK